MSMQNIIAHSACVYLLLYALTALAGPWLANFPHQSTLGNELSDTAELIAELRPIHVIYSASILRKNRIAAPQAALSPWHHCFRALGHSSSGILVHAL